MRLFLFLFNCRLFQVVGKIDDTLALLNLVSSPSFLRRRRRGVESRPPGVEAHAGLLQRPVPTRPLKALGGQVRRPAWSDLLAVSPPSQACMMTITFLPFTVSAVTSQASLRAPGPPPGEGAHSPRRSLLRDADDWVGLGCTAGKRRGSRWQSYLPGEGCSLGFPSWVEKVSAPCPYLPSAIPGLPQCVAPTPLSPTDSVHPELGPGFP